MFFAHYFQ